MFKPIIRLGAIIAVTGTGLFTAEAISNLSAIALPDAEIREKLAPIPVFTITDSEGSPVVIPGEDNTQYAGAFISQDDANDFLAQMKAQNPELAEKVAVVPVSLGQVFKLSEGNRSRENAFNFAYIPEQEAVISAKDLAETSQQPYKGGVPLFVIKGGINQEFVAFSRKNQQVIPFFFDRTQTEELIAQFEKRQPAIAAQMFIEAYSLETLIEQLKARSDEAIKKVVLIPSTESIKFWQDTSTVPEEETLSQ
ncbi:MAG: Tic22 family protein [Cyanobacteria bacterium J06643_13]